MRSSALLAATLALACGRSEETTVVVHVQAGAELPPISALTYFVEQGTTSDMGNLATDAGTLDFPTTFALLVPRERSGKLSLAVVGLSANGAVVAAGATVVDLKPGKRVDAVVVLSVGSAGLDAGTAMDDAGAPSSDGGPPDTAPDATPSQDAATGDLPQMTDRANEVGADPAPADVSPPSKTLGAPCGSATECASGACVDGLCCENQCEGNCRACNIDGARGRCTVVPAGQDPRGRCMKHEGPCGQDGLCDGTGQCRRPVPGTPCSPPRCANAVLTPAGSCDQAGSCAVPAPQVCPGGCSGDATGCAPPPTKLANGQPCTSNGDCLSSACADGVCCETACPSSCHACNLPNALGKCLLVPNGEDPRGDCAEQVGQPCGRDGLCDGAGACRVRPRDTPCGSASCSGSTKSSARACDGAGNCQPPTTTSCLPATCNAAGTDCDTTCANNPAGCPAGQLCSSNCGIPSICCRP